MQPAKRLAAIFIFIASCAWAPANAITITIEPDDFAPGTNLTSAVEGITLLTFASLGNRAYGFSGVYAGSEPACIASPLVCEAVTGNTGFSPRSDGFSGSRGWWEAGEAALCFTYVLSALCSSGERFSALLMIFDAPTDFVEISGTYHSDWPVLHLFDAERNFLGSSFDGGLCVTQQTHREPMYEYNVATSACQSSTANFSYALAASWAANSSLDVLRFNVNAQSVPEPGTLALLGLGLVGLGFARRNQQN